FSKSDCVAILKKKTRSRKKKILFCFLKKSLFFCKNKKKVVANWTFQRRTLALEKENKIAPFSQNNTQQFFDEGKMYLGDKVWACWVTMFLLMVVLIRLWVLPLCQFIDGLELLPPQEVNQTQKVDSLPKKMVKIVFVVGLEGTGHHFYDEFHRQIAIANSAKGGGDNTTMFIDASFASRYLEGRGHHGLHTTNWNICF
ncbi:hypothetical protein RFI_16364, partial [Reticulomyxa filosa]